VALAQNAEYWLGKPVSSCDVVLTELAARRGNSRECRYDVLSMSIIKLYDGVTPGVPLAACDAGKAMGIDTAKVPVLLFTDNHELRSFTVQGQLVSLTD